MTFKHFGFPLLTCLAVMFFFPSPLTGGETLRVAIPTFPDYLHPFYSTDETSQAVINKIFDGLFHFSADGSILPHLVKSYTLNHNGREIILHLRHDIFFSDGKNLQAQDVVQTMHLMKNPLYYYPYLSETDNFREIIALDHYTVKLLMDQPMANWKHLLTFKILNANELHTADPVSFQGKKLSGSGPYKIKSIQRPFSILLERNTIRPPAKPFSNPQPHSHPGMFKYIEYSLISYAQMGPLKLLANDIDICELQPEHADAYSHSPQWQKEFNIFRYKKIGYTYLIFNLKKKNISLNARRKFFEVLVCSDFIKLYLQEHGEHVLTPFPGLESRVQRPQIAQVHPLPQPIQLSIMVNQESHLRKNFILFLCQRFKPLNIHLKPQFIEYHTFLYYLKNGHFDLAISSFLFNSDEDVRSIFSRQSLFNYSGLDCPPIEAILTQAACELNLEKRTQLYLQADRLWQEHLPILPLFKLNYYMGIRHDIKPPAHQLRLITAAGDFLSDIEQWTCTPRSFY